MSVLGYVSIQKKKMYKCKMIHFKLCKSARTFCHVMFGFLGDMFSQRFKCL